MFNINMQKKNIPLALLAILPLLFAGCTHDLRKEKNTMIDNSQVQYNSTYSKNSQEAKLEVLMNRPVQANFVQSTVYYAVSQVAKSLDLEMDTVFRPSSDQRLTMNFKGTLGDFLEQVYNQTSIKYKYRNGLLQVFNQKEVEQQHKVGRCGGKPTVHVALDDTIPAQVFKYMSEKYGMNLTFDTRIVSLKPTEGEGAKPYIGNTSFYYKGCDRKEALRKFAKAIDVALEWKNDNTVVVRDYEMAELDIPTYFNYAFSSSGGGLSGGSSGGSGGTAGTGNVISTGDDFKAQFTEEFSKYLSPSGKLHISNRGYAVVTDRPSNIADIKRLVRIEKRRQVPMHLSVAIIRVDVLDSIKVGVDWNVALNNVAKYLNTQGFLASINMADSAAGGLSLSSKEGGLQSMVNALQVYGKAKIVRDFNSKTRSGILSTYKAVDQIPYVTSSVVTTDGVSQVATEAKVAEAGLIVNVIGTVSDDGEVAELATNIVVSEYKGDKIFSVNGGEYKLPEISTNDIQMPVRVRMGRSIVLTGFKLSKHASANEGIPGASQAGGLMGGLFGNSSTDSQESEFLIVLTPKKIKDY